MNKSRDVKIWIDCRLYSNGKTGIGRLTKELIEFYNMHLGIDHVGLFVSSRLDFSNNQVQTLLKPFHLTDFIKFPKFLETHGVLTIHSPFYSGLSAKHTMVKSILTVPDIMYRLTPEFFSRNCIVNYCSRTYFDLIVKPSILNADKVISISNTTRENILNWLSKDSVVIYPADYLQEIWDDDVEVSKFQGTGLIGDEYFLYAGNSRPHKNVGFLVDAHKKSNTNKKLVLVGSAFLEYKSDRVVCLGIVSDDLLRALYQQCCAFIFPSLSEGFGYPMLEASSLGRPIIASDINIFRELNISDVNYFDPHDKKTLTTILDNSELLKPTTLDSDRFNQKNFNKKHAEIFNQLNSY
jgi:glycosyltransferase involved in cell wall biosynthesis